jgi:hypothetical protein
MGQVVRSVLSVVYNSYTNCGWSPWMIWVQI